MDRTSNSDMEKSLWIVNLLDAVVGLEEIDDETSGLMHA